jgi:hypothetical protein
MSTEKTWMSAEQFAQVLDVYAQLREQYIPVEVRAPGMFHDPETRDGDRHMLIEVAAMRNAAWALRNLDEVPIGIPSWLTDEYSNAIELIKHGSVVPAVGEQP